LEGGDCIIERGPREAFFGWRRQLDGGHNWNKYGKYKMDSCSYPEATFIQVTSYSFRESQCAFMAHYLYSRLLNHTCTISCTFITIVPEVMRTSPGLQISFSSFAALNTRIV